MKKALLGVALVLVLIGAGCSSDKDNNTKDASNGGVKDGSVLGSQVDGEDSNNMVDGKGGFVDME